ncbi:hypothetical protein AJ78_08399 [Emergomyces pasteurianus Ep9510]|uniref:Uncharacterized protein n=1 Tax=Emergomyces pasteurianus Ep9510 TaxID=1447872 RepID=A0A1J9PS18_9EURO|nr:hypothetical protein AJ78_08399 [Emergomyces pasteurianus Ep9510]
MSSPSICRSWLHPQPRLTRHVTSYLRPAQRVTFDRISLEEQRSKARPEPSASQLLRFAITGTLKTPDNRYYSETLEKYILEAFSNPHLPETWTIFNSAPSKSKFMNRNVPGVDRFDPAAFKARMELPKLHALCERYIVSPIVAREVQKKAQGLTSALEFCGGYEHPDKILATLNAIVARFSLLGVQVPKDLLILGMRFAARHFSAPALRSYIQSYVSAGYGPLPGRSAAKVIRNLYLACKSSIFESPVVDLGPMREVVTGLDENESQTLHSSLHHLLFNSGDACPHFVYSQYVRLLGVIGGYGRLLDIWPAVQDRLKSGPTDPPAQTLAKMYLRALLRSGFGSRALYCAEQLSTISNLNEFLPISIWKHLLQQNNSEVLQKIIPSQAANAILSGELHSMEKRLGITWNLAGGGHHVKTADMDPWWDHWPADAVPSGVDLDSSLPGPSSATKRLIAEIESHGSSKSTMELARIANLLHDFEGSEHPLGSINDESGQTREFAWFPQCCPIEFAGNIPPSRYDIAGPQSPSSLGLIRALHDVRGKTIRLHTSNLYLMQLGYLCERRPVSPGSVNSKESDAGKWGDTGHIICWNRIERCLMMIFIGKGWGTIDPGLYPRDSHPYLPSVAKINLKQWTNFQSEFSEKAGLLWPLDTRYWLAVDPGAYLDS